MRNEGHQDSKKTPQFIKDCKNNASKDRYDNASAGFVSISNCKSCLDNKDNKDRYDSKDRCNGCLDSKDRFDSNDNAGDDFIDEILSWD